LKVAGERYSKKVIRDFPRVNAYATREKDKMTTRLEKSLKNAYYTLSEQRKIIEIEKEVFKKYDYETQIIENLIKE